MNDTYKTAKIIHHIIGRIGIIRSSYYIVGLWCDEINFCCFICVTLDGPYTLL